MFKNLIKNHKNRLILITLGIEFGIIVSIFLFSVIYLQKNVEDDIQDKMLSLARYASYNIEAEWIEKILGSQDVYFNKVKEQLALMEKTFDLREGLAYIVELKNGEPVFSVMTNERPFRNHVYPEEVSRQIHDVFETGQEKISDLYEDRNGTFISVLVPLLSGDETVAVLEIDFPGEDYKEKLFDRLVPFLIGLFLLLFISFTAIFIILIKLYNAREQQFRQTQLQLIQTEKMNLLSRLVAGIAHEINSPISSIKSTVYILNRTIENISSVLSNGHPERDEQVKNSIDQSIAIFKENNQVALSAADRIDAIVKRLKNFARIDEAAFKKTDITEGINSTLSIIQPEMKDRIQIVKEYRNIPPIYAYPVQLNQVFMSILVNASEAIEESGTITIKTFSDKKNITIKIADTGKGIPPDKIDKLFDMNFTTKNSRIGLGMGLANACNIVQKHHGKINVKSEVGKGTEFIITLPLDLSVEKRMR